MTNRERIIQTLLCKPTDRVPFGVSLGFLPWGSTLERWRQESGIKDLNINEYFGYDQGFITLPLEQGPFPHIPEKIISQNEEFIIKTDWRGITMRNRRDGNSMPEFLAHPIRTPDDWERYKDEKLQPHLTERIASLNELIATYKKIDAPIQVGSFPWGMFGTPRDLLGTEELLIGFYTQPELIKDIINTYTDLWLKLFAEVENKIHIDHIHIWEDMSGKTGSLISMQMVEEFMMPSYDRIADFAAKHNIPLISVDSDGLVNELLEVMIKHGVNVFLPFEVQAGNDILEYRKKYPFLGIIGGLDKNTLSETAPKEAMYHELDKAEEMLSFGGYIPAFDHLIPPNVPWHKWKFFMNELKKIIGL